MKLYNHLTLVVFREECQAFQLNIYVTPSIKTDKTEHMIGHKLMNIINPQQLLLYFVVMCQQVLHVFT